MIGDSMNKKGFTLVELLATITILILMSVIIGVNITSILKSTENNQKDFDKKQIEKAACVYVDSDSLCSEHNCDNNVTIEALIKSGLLDESYKSVTGTITITRTGNKKICKYSE